MVILLYAFLLGCVCGLRSMTAPALVAWGAHLGWLHLDGSLLAFFANKISLVSGYTYRHRLSSMVPDMLLALIEDLVAVGGGFLLVSHL
jgi:uncharacterized membrane protein